jgi:hypothetical protein
MVVVVGQQMMIAVVVVVDQLQLHQLQMEIQSHQLPPVQTTTTISTLQSSARLHPPLAVSSQMVTVDQVVAVAPVVVAILRPVLFIFQLNESTRCLHPLHPPHHPRPTRLALLEAMDTPPLLQ